MKEDQQAMIKRLTRFIPLAIVPVLTLVVHAAALRNDFVAWDDDLYIVDNPAIRSLDLSFVQWAFTTIYTGYWHPLTWLSHALDYAVWGMDPRGHHLTSILLHAVNAFLAAVAAMMLLEARRDRAVRTGTATSLTDARIALAGAVTGLLFGLHPLHVESAAWVAERKDLLCGLFFLLSLMAYTRYVRNAADRPEGRGSVPGPVTDRWYVISLAMFLLALLSKPMAVTLPVVLLILDWHPFGRLEAGRNLMPLLREKLPFIALSIIASVVTLLAQRAEGGMAPLSAVPLTTRLVVAAHSLVAYLGKMLVPAGLIPLYPYPRDASLLSPEYGGSVLLVAGMTAAAVLLAKRRPLWPALWGYYVITLLPVLGLVQVGLQPMADRYTYLPSLGPFLLAGLALSQVAVRSAPAADKGGSTARFVVIAAAVAVAALLALLTVRQIGIWRSTVDLWTAVIVREPARVPEAYFKRGNAFRLEGQDGRALADYDRAVALDPSFPQVYINRGALRGGLGRIDLALQDFNAAIALDPSLAAAYGNRALAYLALGRPAEALQDLDREIALDPSAARAYLHRGRIHLQNGSRALAAADLRTGCGLGEREACIALRMLGP